MLTGGFSLGCQDFRFQTTAPLAPGLVQVEVVTWSVVENPRAELLHKRVITPFSPSEPLAWATRAGVELPPRVHVCPPRLLAGQGSPLFDGHADIREDQSARCKHYITIRFLSRRRRLGAPTPCKRSSPLESAHLVRAGRLPLKITFSHANRQFIAPLRGLGQR